MSNTLIPILVDDFVEAYENYKREYLTLVAKYEKADKYLRETKDKGFWSWLFRSTLHDRLPLWADMRDYLRLAKVGYTDLEEDAFLAKYNSGRLLKTIRDGVEYCDGDVFMAEPKVAKFVTTFRFNGEEDNECT